MRLLLIQISMLFLLLSASCGCNKENKKPDPDPGPDPVVTSEVEMYVTSANRSNLFTVKEQNFNTKPNMSPRTVKLDYTVKYQEMDGFGAAITGSTAYNLLKMSADDRAALLKEVFDPKDGMGYSYVRVSLGCSDFSMDQYTYCDTKGIDNFAIHDLDKRDLIPVLKEILAINPDIKIMASPWTAPLWMKVNSLEEMKSYNSWTGGQLNPLCYADYAEYFVRYIKAMAAEGIHIESVTPQNEPLHKGNSASMFMGWAEAADFVKVLGPAFAKNGISTKIIVYDHNYNYDDISEQKSYPLNIYRDREAAKYIAGSAWHAYGGSVSELDNIHSGAPDMGIFFTEMSIGEWSASSKEACFSGDLMWNMRECCLGTINRYCKAVIMWNLLLDQNQGPYRPGGCSTCYGCIDMDPTNYASIEKNSHFYTMGHLSKVVRPGAFRIGNSGYTVSGLYYSTFLNVDGSYAAVALNDSDSEISLTFDDGTKSFGTKIPAKSIASYRWKNK